MKNVLLVTLFSICSVAVFSQTVEEVSYIQIRDSAYSVLSEETILDKLKLSDTTKIKKSITRSFVPLFFIPKTLGLTRGLTNKEIKDILFKGEASIVSSNDLFFQEIMILKIENSEVYHSKSEMKKKPIFENILICTAWFVGILLFFVSLASYFLFKKEIDLKKDNTLSS